jgi:UDP-2,3-diacylglucosamine pyrophosphatase LpxH
MPTPRKKSTRAIIISDLHLGGNAPRMMSRPKNLARFLEGVSGRLGSDETLELIIAGDFVDFLAITPQASWTPDPAEACSKIRNAMKDGDLASIFEAMGKLLAKDGNKLTILVGNHDVEMGLPPVQDALLEGLDCTRHQAIFVDTGRAYGLGKALIEHGNRYDDANTNDWQGLRAIAAAMSRHEEPKDELLVSAGSRIVEQIINPLKSSSYPFIDLLQPQGELVALLMLAFEPGLKWELNKLRWLLRGRYLEGRNQNGLQPGKSRYVSYRPLDTFDNELQETFGDSYTALRTPDQQVGLSLADWTKILLTPGKDGIAAILRKGEHVPSDRLQQIRVAMRKLLMDDQSNQPDGPTQQYGEAAKRLIEDSGGKVEVVVMGHTHLARHIGPRDKATYINTGTWADVVRAPEEAMRDGADEALEEFLRDLLNDKRPNYVPTYGDLRIEANGEVSRAQLQAYMES